MDYTHLTEKQALQLRHERLATLEAEHYRLRLAEEEHDNPPAELAVQLADMARRIALHREALGIVVPPPDDAEVGDTPGSGDVNNGEEAGVADAVAHDEPR